MSLTKALRPQPAALRRGGDLVLRRSPLQPLARATNSRRLAVLAYHGVDDAAGFERQLDLLTRWMNPVSLDDVLGALDGAPLPSGAVLVTFDDGDPTVLSRGAPLLQARGIPAVAFVCPGVIGTREPFWWTEVETLYAVGARVQDGPADSAARLVGWLKTVSDERRHQAVAELRKSMPWVHAKSDQLAPSDLPALEAAGIEVGNHTWSHPCLDRCADGEPEGQVERAHEWLTDALGRTPRTFAYPNGNHDPRAEAELERLGYAAGFMFDHRLAEVPGTRTHPLRLSRLRVSTTTSDDRFALILSGLHSGLHRLRGGV
jgi:peptidoglycan/xylan/chitin deacetylase (PgdA/CDA1 family)